ncbi:hypothetical protein EW146_g4346 [Bondarzewia mesenterica]|uniref:L-tyrosine decarboxylase C-terminal domain-containing protein n=1 Tax=Bondarzewia mesenterica TaxID=1095465 RepID=A0A4S4LWQ2_9AGAM|nr:hypothetical protein EW146_g4346 [Bondarzewia mesenterica]
MSPPIPHRIPQQHRISSNEDHERVSALFLGPKAENFDMLKDFIISVLKKQRLVRESYFPDDPQFIGVEIQSSHAFRTMKKSLEKELDKLSDLLNEKSVPFFSPRYSGHMSTDVTLPGILGYMSTMMLNPNNVVFESSPITTCLEIEVGEQLCDMLGYPNRAAYGDGTDLARSWGHITCDGTVANLEAIWAARNLKFYPLSLRDAMKDGAPLAFVSNSFVIELCNGDTILLKDADSWDLLNLKASTILDIPHRLYTRYNISPTFLERIMSQYSIQSVTALVKHEILLLAEMRRCVCSHVHPLVSETFIHFIAISGIGSDNVVGIPVDHDARINIQDLRDRLQERMDRRQAVYAVVAIIGTTEEGAVDSLDEILRLRGEFQSQHKGLSFLVHADAAWGGYFATMLPKFDIHMESPSPKQTHSNRDYVAHVGLRRTTAVQLAHLRFADSITIDPHKSGYIPYPAGGLCYRDGRMRFLLTWTAPYLHHAEGESIGIYGVEGSKPGAAAAAVWLSHRVIGLNPSPEGDHWQWYGAILGEASFTCRRFACHWAAMSKENDYVVIPFNPLPIECDTPNASDVEIEAQREWIRNNILTKENQELVKDNDAMELLNRLGSDLNVNAFACNFYDSNGRLNTDVDEANYLNQRIFERLSFTSRDRDPRKINFYITSTVFAQSDYKDCATHFKNRLGLRGNQDLFVLRNVVMSPFSTSGNFVQELADNFRNVLKQELKVVRLRGELKDTHEFLIQGRDKLYLVHLPCFHRASRRYQLVVSGNVSFRDFIRDPSTSCILRTTTPDTLDNLLSRGSFQGCIMDTAGSYVVEVTNIEVVKYRPLDTKHLAVDYPDSIMPFYLYGTPDEQHIDHMLLRAPNIQLSAANVALSTDPVLISDDLQKGLILYAEGLHERSMQPFLPTSQVLQNEYFFLQKKTNIFLCTSTKILTPMTSMGLWI